MKILVVGSGGREHALCSAFARSPKVERIFCADGNAGIAALAECVAIKPHEIEKLVAFAAAEAIDLTFVGGETALALGIADEFEKQGLRIVGVSGAAARLEASKSFAKDFMARHAIPTAAYRTAFSPREAKSILESGVFGDESAPVVVKADGLAAGKGVVVAPTRADALAAIDELEALVGAEAAERIVLEECLYGREVSLILFSDGQDFALMPPVRDHKRIGEGDTGPNTGGMGTVSDRTLLSDDQLAAIVETVVKPSLAGAEADGFPIRGILFIGLMMTIDGAKVLEYNVRFGDPETQVILTQLATDLIDICDAVVDGKLGDIDVEWFPGSAACVVLAAANYPDRPRVGDVISGLDAATAIDGVEVFHAGTKTGADGQIATSGGRVLGVTACGGDLETALAAAYAAVTEISWNGMQFRRDIGR